MSMHQFISSTGIYADRTLDLLVTFERSMRTMDMFMPGA